MPSTSPYEHKSYIKDVCIELPGYQFNHRPYNKAFGDNFEFIGREENIQQFIDIILNGGNNGAYLVAGYRGMGKTSFVNKVLDEAEKKLKKKKGRRLRQVNVSFGKSNMVYNDLLKQLIVSLMQNITSKGHRLLLWIIRPANILFLAMALYLGLLTDTVPYPDALNKFFLPSNIKENGFNIITPAIISLVTSFLFIKLLSMFAFVSPSIRIHYRLQRLYSRSGAEISEEENVQSIVKSINFGLFSKSTTKYPPLTSKEIEIELIDIINRIDRTSIRPWHHTLSTPFNKFLRLFNYYRENMYVFVFDEMDKIDPGIGGEDYYKEMRDNKGASHDQTYIDEQRDRKQMMVNIISSMKNLITGSRAKFMFIAGREMFEASLADIADRQFSLGSIFNKIIYIDSFLKDKQGNDPSGLSNLIENYLKHLMLPPDFIKERETIAPCIPVKDQPFLFIYHEYLNHAGYVDQNSLCTEEKTKIIILLQQFVIFLTYRTNGSPKKLNRIVEDFIMNGELLFKDNDSRRLKLLVEKKSQKPVKNRKSLYLYLSYNNQFRFGFITFLYRPFLLNYSRRLKNYSDYLLVSTTYLVDHILKFHPVAFSTKNLELLPEVLSANRTPQMRNFIDDILHFLSFSYIRDTEISLFEYKFFNKISNELLHLTNLFEEESAAFNFTLDESFPIKNHIRNKILELRRIHKDYKATNYEFIHSISSLNNLLGDVRFFDQEYNDAITAYSDAIQALHFPKVKLNDRVEIVMLIIQLHLKIGLTYEKIKNYENALACYTDAMNYAKKTIEKYCTIPTVESPKETVDAAERSKEPVDATDRPKETDEGSGLPNPALVSVNELLQTSLQAFMANLYLIEKISPNGVSVAAINETLGLLGELFKEIETKHYSTFQARFLVLHHVAVLCFYKNTYIHDVWNKVLANRLTDPVNEPKDDDGSQRIRIQLNDHLTLNPPQFKDYRLPNLSFRLSLLALHELIKYYESLYPLPDNELIRFFKLRLESSAQLRNEGDLIFVYSFLIIQSDDIHKVSDKSLLTNFAIILARIGDILLTNLNIERREKEGKIDFLQVFSLEELEILDTFNEKGIIPEKTLWSKIDEVYTLITQGVSGNTANRTRLVLVCYFLSSKYYSAASKMTHCSSQLKRMLRLVNSVTSINPSNPNNARVIFLLEKLVLGEILKNISTNSNSTDRSQILRYKYYLNINSLHYPLDKARLIYGNLANNPEIREAIILFAEMKMKATRLSHTFTADLTSLAEELTIVNPNNTISFQWTRIIELKFQADFNWKLLEDYFRPQFTGIVDDSKSFDMCWREKLFPLYCKLPLETIREMVENNSYTSPDPGVTGINSEDPNKELLDFFAAIRASKDKPDFKPMCKQFLQVICNSIHSLNHIVEILQTYGTNYPASNTFTGDQYKNMGNWMQLYYLGLELQKIVLDPGEFDLRYELELLIGVEPLRSLEPMFLYQTAVLNYRRAIELHHEGNIYKIRIQSLNYLDDDFNDSIDHFAAALEKQRINSGYIRENIDKLDRLLNKSQLFNYRSYVNND